MHSSDITTSPYDDVKRFFVLVPSASIFGSLSSGLRLVIRLISEDQMFVDFGVMIGALTTVVSDLFDISHGT